MKPLPDTSTTVVASASSATVQLPQQPFKFSFLTSRQFQAWLNEHKLSLAFTTYSSHRLFFVGSRSSDGHFYLSHHLFGRAMGLCANPDHLWLSSLFQLWRFDNILSTDQIRNGCDRFYVPAVAYTTGDVDIHDISLDGRGHPIFVNTLYSCLASLEDGYSFAPVWWPPFISKLAAEDRCHLNGLAIKDGAPAYVTCVARTDVADGWRDYREGGGIVVDIDRNTIILDGLSMPHSPRWYNGRLWLLESGTGYFGYVDPARGCFERLAFCPGYLRGLAFYKQFAVIGLSKPRSDRTFRGLPLDANLADRRAAPVCGLMIIDMESGDIVHWLKLDGSITELYDVAVIPDTIGATSISVADDELRRIVRMGPAGSSPV